MSYSDTENEHHEAISGGIVALRNEVAKLTASAHNMRGQGLACDDADRARALYESGAAYADAAYRVGAIVNDFEQAESYRAGAMEAIGPVPTYDELGGRLAQAESSAKAASNRVEFLEGQISLLDEALGGEGRASTEEVVNWAAATARALRRFRGIRDAAVHLLDKVGGQYSAHTLVDLMTILLDGDSPETLAKFKATVVQPEPLLKLPKISPELGEQIKRLAGSLVTPSARFEPSVDQLVTGHDVTDVDGELTTGRVTFVDTDAVTVELARYHERTGWHLGYASLDRMELRPSLPPEVNAFVRNLQLAKADGVTEEPDANLLTRTSLDDVAQTSGTPEPGDIVIVTEGGVGQAAQFVGLDTSPLYTIVQIPEEASVGDGHVWAKRRVHTAALSKAAPDQVGDFLQELEAKGLDSVIR